jgi:hypothetical protein
VASRIEAKQRERDALMMIALPISLADINVTLTIMSLVLAVLGILSAYYFYQKSLRERKPAYAVYTTVLIGGVQNVISDLQVLYRGQPVDEVSVSTVMFWNDGKETITKDDIADRIRFEPLNGVEILNAELVESLHPPNHFVVERATDGAKVWVDFDYLDFEQGALIQIVHTGMWGEVLKVEGSIHGVNEIKRMDSYGRSKLANTWHKYRSLSVFFLLILLCEITISLSLATRPPFSRIHSLIITSAFLSVLGMIAWFVHWVNSPLLGREWEIRQRFRSFK